MRLRIAAHLPRSQHICEIEADPHSTVGQLAYELIETFEPEQLGGGRTATSDVAWTVALPSRPALDPVSTLAAAGIGMGSNLTVVRAPRMRFRPRMQRHALEVVISGRGTVALRGLRVAVGLADCGARGGGRGRGGGCRGGGGRRCGRGRIAGAVRAVEPGVVFELRGRTWHVAEPIDCQSNGHPLERSWPIEAGDVLTTGGHTLAVRSSVTAPFPQPSPHGHLNIHRSAPRNVSTKIESVELAAPPEQTDQARWPTWSIFGSLLSAGLMYLVWPQWYIVAWMAISSLWTIFSVIESRQQHRGDLRKRTADWETRLADAIELLTSRRHLEALQLHAHFPSPTALIGRVRSLSGQLWNSTVSEESSVVVRVGAGAARSTIGLHLSDEPNDPAVAVRTALPNETPLTDVPLTVDLQHGPLGICGPTELRTELWNALALQLATRWSPLECTILSIGFDAPPTDWLAHATLPSTVACEAPLSAAALLDVVHGLDEQEQRTSFTVLALNGTAKEDILEFLPALRLVIARGIHVVWLAEHRDDLLGGVRTIVDCSDGAVHREDVDTGERLEIERPDLLGTVEFHECCTRLAPLRDAEATETQADLPEVIDLRELPTQNTHGLAATLGRTLQRELVLDLKADGPHALVAGTTGSGKSEFLRSWICAIARESLPSAVTFMLIDYKGGAAFRDCAELPHVVGMLTDLDPSLATRVLVSLRAEIRWREEHLAAAGAKDLHELEQHGVSPFPSLVIVADEFATLARDIPEFIDGMLDIAQRGRSLGIHLILATQRPSGVVTDAIRANTNIRVCLRVPDDEDARDVVGSVDPARISGQHPGRGYLRIGHLPPVLFQSAYVSGAAVDLGRKRVRIVRALTAPAAFTPPRIADEASTTTSIHHLVSEAIARAAAAGVASPRRPWMDNLPERISLNELDGYLAASTNGAQ